MSQAMSNVLFPTCDLPRTLLSLTFAIGVLASAIGLTFAAPAYAEGSAVFASVATEQEAQRLTPVLQDKLGTSISTSSVWVDGVNWIRLHSGVLSESDARALVARARAKGHEAWYNSAGNRWAQTEEQSPARRSTASAYASSSSSSWNSENAVGNEDASSYGSDQDAQDASVQPFTGNILDLPLAETFPLE